MDITAFVRTPVVILALLVAVAACGPGKPVGPTPEEVKRQAEQAELARLRAVEQERLAREEAERKAAEEARLAKEAVELPKAIDPKPPEPAALASETVSAREERLAVPTMPPQPPPTSTMTAAQAAAAAVAAAGGAAPGSTVAPLIAGSGAGASEAPTVPYDQAFPPIPDRLLRVAVISAPSQANVAERIGTMLAVTEKDRLESALGMGLQIAYLSQADRNPKRETRIQYREKYLQAAVRLASVIPQAQKVERMGDAEANRMGVDVLIQVGADLR